MVMLVFEGATRSPDSMLFHILYGLWLKRNAVRKILNEWAEKRGSIGDSRVPEAPFLSAINAWALLEDAS